MAREVAAAAYRHGARFVDVTYFDPYVKRAQVDGYRARARADPVRFARIDALQPPPLVAAQIEAVLQERGW